MSVFAPQNPDQNSDSVFKSSLKEIRIRVEESSVSIVSDRSPPQTVLNATHLIEPAFFRTRIPPNPHSVFCHPTPHSQIRQPIQYKQRLILTTESEEIVTVFNVVSKK